VVCRLDRAYFRHLRLLFPEKEDTAPRAEPDAHEDTEPRAEPGAPNESSAGCGGGGSAAVSGGDGARCEWVCAHEATLSARCGRAGSDQSSQQERAAVEAPGGGATLREDQVVFGVVSGRAMYETRARAVAQTWLARPPTDAAHSSSSSGGGGSAHAHAPVPGYLTHTYIYGDERYELLAVRECTIGREGCGGGGKRVILPVPVPPTPEHGFLSRLTLHDDFFSSVSDPVESASPDPSALCVCVCVCVCVNRYICLYVCVCVCVCMYVL